MNKAVFLKLVLSAFLLFASTVAVNSQTVFFSENMGTPATTTAITSYSGWQNNATNSFTGNGDVRTTSASSTYTGASGGGNVWLSSVSGSYSLVISGINTSLYTNISLTFGSLATTSGTRITVEYSTDGNIYTALTLTSNIATTWGLISPTGTIPSTSNLRLRFSKTGTVGYRIDDVKLTGTLAGATAPVLAADNTLNTVDNNIDIAFTDNASWRSAITSVKIGTTILTANTDYIITPGNLQLIPSGGNPLLTTSGTKALTVVATGYADATVSQLINAGLATANSTVSGSSYLLPNTTTTITCTAKDQYNNPVSGYIFKYAMVISNANPSTNESYQVDGISYTSSASGLSTTSTNSNGVATFSVALPATIDGADGISIQVMMKDGITNIGTAFSFAQLQSQTLSFGTLGTVTYGDTSFYLTATASSGLPVTFSSSNTSVATVSGSTITIVGVGIADIKASQAGNSSYNAAPDIIRSLTVIQKQLTVPNAAVQNKTYDGTNTAVISGTLSGVVNSDDVILNGTGLFADVNAADNITVFSTSTLAGTRAANYSLLQPTGLSAGIQKALQVITFNALTGKSLGDADYAPYTYSVTSALNPITFSSSNPAVATVISNQIHIVGVGTTNITASQAGSTNYSPADVVQPLIVTAGPIVAWNPSGLTNYGFMQWNPTTSSPYLTIGGLTRAPGLNTNGSAAPSSWGGTMMAVYTTPESAIANSQFVTFSLAPKAGYTLSLYNLDLVFRRSATGPSSGVLQYSLDNTSFTDITAISFASTNTNGFVVPQIDLSSVAALQSLKNTTVIFRIVLYNNSGTGAWYVYGTGLSIHGNIAAATPTVSVAETSIPYMPVTMGQSVIQTINVTGVSLTDNIKLALSGANADQFSISTDTIKPIDGTVLNTIVTITHTPTFTGSHNATLTLSSPGAVDIVLSLSGNATWPSLEKPVISSVTPTNSEITANWNIVIGANEYQLDLYKTTGTHISEGFDGGFASPAEGWSYSGLTSDYITLPTIGNNIPALRLDVSGASILSKLYDTAPTEISFWMKGNGNDAYSALLVESWDGSQWTTLENICPIPYSATKIYNSGNSNWKNNFVQFRLTYSKSVGNVGIDDFVYNLNYVATPVDGSPFIGITDLFKTVSGIQGGCDYYLTVTAKNPNVNSPVSNEFKISTLTTGLVDKQSESAVSCVNGKLIISAQTGELIEIYNSLGQKIMSRKMQEGINALTLPAKGVLLIKTGSRILKIISN